jgi:hypothetical protein
VGSSPRLLHDKIAVKKAPVAVETLSGETVQRRNSIFKFRRTATGNEHVPVGEAGSVSRAVQQRLIGLPARCGALVFEDVGKVESVKAPLAKTPGGPRDGSVKQGKTGQTLANSFKALRSKIAGKGM